MSAELDSDAVEELLEECLDRAPSEWTLFLEEQCRSHPALADELRKRFELLRQAGLLQEESEGEFPERLGPFHLLERLGGGGMGVVFLAHDETLGREVALKLIRPEHLFFEGSRRRFRREIEAVARLQHPGIVPIYSVGEEKSVPYFAMERVRGATLSEVVQDLRTRDPAELSAKDLAQVVAARAGTPTLDDERILRVFGSTWIEAVLHVTRAIAEALEHAHGRGVLHRDVKPSNVMLTPDGRVLLLDFGLAQAKGSEQLTRTGSTLGSLAYMPPEQVRGEHRELTPRTDVYSLGVTLYELLALRLPFTETDGEALRREILRGEFPLLRPLNRHVAWDLETVCRQAMERDPERRYATAGALARDLSNLLEKRPIEARRAGTWLRLTRWVQRHPAASVAIVAASIALPTLAAVQLRGELRTERERARQTLQTTRYLVHELYRKLADVPRGAEVVAPMIGDVLTSLERLEVEGSARGAELSSIFAFAKMRLGDAELELSAAEPERLDAADQAFTAAIRRYDELLAEQPGELDAERGRAACWERRSVVAARRSDHEAAIRFAETSRDLRAALARIHPANPEVQRDALAGEMRVAEALAAADRPTAAVTQLEATCARLEELCEREPEFEAARRDLSGAFEQLGRARALAGDTAGAVTPYEAALAIDRELARSPHAPVEWKHKRASQARELALALLRLERIPDGQTRMEEAYDAYRTLLLADPLDGIARYGYARCAADLGFIAHANHGGDAAHALLVESYTIGRGLDPTGAPAATYYDEFLAALTDLVRSQATAKPSRLANLGLDLLWRTLRSAPRSPREEHLEGLLTLSDEVLRACESNAVVAYEASKVLLEHAMAWRDEDANLALRLFELGTRFFEGAGRTLDPPATKSVEFFSQGWGGLHHRGELLLSEGDDRAAQESFERAEELAVRAATSVPEAAPFLSAARASATFLAKIAMEGGDTDGALRHGRRALERAEQAAAAPAAGADEWNGCAWTLLTVEPPSLRDPERALTLAARAQRSPGGDRSEVLDTLARALHECHRDEEAIRAQERALELLRQETERRDQLLRLQEMQERLAAYRRSANG